MPIPPLAVRLSLAALLAAGLVALPALAKDEVQAKTSEKAGAAKTQRTLADLAKALDGISPQSVAPAAKAMIKVTGKDGKSVDAELTAVDAGGYSFASKEDPAGRQTWLALGSAAAANDILKKAVAPKDAGQNILAARILINLKMGAPVADFYLKQAVFAIADKELAATPLKQLQAATLDLAIADYNRLKPEWAWPRLTAAQHDACIEELGRAIRADAVKAKLKFPLTDQSEHFIFYTDADLATARLWARKLEAAYERLCKTFDLDPRQNVWQGKCAVVLCRNHESYLKWMNVVAKDSPMAGKSAGLSISNSVFAGSNTIHFFHNPGNLAYTETTLVHELSHAFTAQFHGNQFLASWANEGLAEYVSSGGKGHESKIQESHERVRATGSLEDFFAAKNIDFKHYGAAFEITSLLIKKNPRGYGRFIKAVTEGQDPVDALKEHCNLTLDQVAAGYARMLGMRGLRSH